MVGSNLPECFVCRFQDAGYPCRRADGAGLDFGKIAREYVRGGHAYGGDKIDQQLSDETRWASECAEEITQAYPDLALPLVIAAIDVCETLEEVSYVAAGVVETMVVRQGPRVIAAIEQLAANSAKFRYALSGIWSQGGSVDDDVWKRIGIAVARGARMSNDGRGPWDGKPVSVFDEAAALKLLHDERVGDIARKMGLIE